MNEDPGTSVTGKLETWNMANIDHKQLLEENETIMLTDQANNDHFDGQSIRLFDKLTIEDLTNLKQKFKSTKSGCLSKMELQTIFNEICPNLFDEEEFHCFYLKLNFKQTGKADWDEFLTYLMMEFEEKGKTTTKVPELVDLPIVTPVKFIKSFHRHPIIRMTYCPTLDMDRKFNYQNGRYLTCSKDGFINYWNLDMVNEKTCIAKLPPGKIAANARVLDMVCMPDVSVVCVCSILRDLRFYDTAARKFELRVMVTDITWPITCLNYSFSQNIEEDSKLIMGDTAGSVFIMVFNSKERGPFTQKPGIDVTTMKFESIVKGEHKQFSVLQFVNVHSDSVCQVQLNATNTFFSCATTPHASLLLCDVTRVRKPYVFNVPGLGISCFAYDEDLHLLVTGGGDGLLRLWNPYVPQKNSGTCKKHDAKVCAITIQKEHHLIYSISKDRCLKVWDSRTKRCIRTLDGLMDIGKNAPSIAIFYNPETHLLMAASVKIALITCLRVINEIYTDGFTHSKTVTKVLYNPLYKTILTVSKDSTIIAWEPFIGRCLFTINHAHTRMELGESKDLPITAAEFDPSKVLLITGSNDGSMKVWNFNEKKCVRNMTTGDDSRVVDIHWISNRVLVMTWHQITEFVYPEGTIVGKTWEAKHTDDLTACAVCPHAFVTGTFNGELIFWRLETGQSLKGFIIVDPEKSKVTELSLKTIKSRKRKDIARSDTHSIVLNAANVTDNDSIDSDITDKSQSDLEVNNYNFESSLLTNHWKSDVTIHAITYLRGGTRLAGADEGAVLVSTNGGFVQMWSTHRSAASGLVYTFKATRDPDVYIMTMATDRLDQYLFTGDSIGYIRIFSMLNLGVPESDRVQIDHLYFYHKFPYYAIVNPDMTFENVSYPILLSCYQGHRKTVTSLNFIQELEVLVSSSTDNSARLWTLEGQYIGTLGNTKYWKQLERNTKAEVVEPRLPPDIKRVCSENTLKVLSYKSTQDFVANVDTMEDDLSNLPVDKIPTYGKPLSEPILGNYFSLPERGKRKIKLPKVDATKGRFVRVYALMASDDKPLKEVASLKNSKPKRFECMH